MDSSSNRIRRHLNYPNVMSTLAVFLVLAGGTALAAGLAKNSVKSKTVKDNALKSVDLRDGKAVAGKDVADDSLEGADVAESTLDQVPDAARLEGRSPSSFVASNVYLRESAVGAGTTLGDGTQYIDQACDAGDVMLSGGPANINAATDLLESFPTPGSTTSWRARVNKNGLADNFSVVVLCANQ